MAARDRAHSMRLSFEGHKVKESGSGIQLGWRGPQNDPDGVSRFQGQRRRNAELGPLRVRGRGEGLLPDESTWRRYLEADESPSALAGGPNVRGEADDIPILEPRNRELDLACRRGPTRLQAEAPLAPSRRRLRGQGSQCRIGNLPRVERRLPVPLEAPVGDEVAGRVDDGVLRTCRVLFASGAERKGEDYGDDGRDTG